MKIPLQARHALPLAVVAGACIPLAAPVANLEPLGFLAPAALYLAIVGQTPRRAFLAGFGAGCAANLGGFYWVVGLLEDFAHLPWALCVLLYVLLCLAGAFGWALASLATALLVRRGALPSVTLPAALVVGEWAVPSVFPWTMAVTQHRFLPLIQIAEWTGAFGVTLVIAIAGTLLGKAILERRPRLAAVAVGVVLAPAAVGLWRLGAIEAARDSAPGVRVGLVQPNIGIFDKHDPRLFGKNLAVLHDLTRRLEERGVELVVWPESAYPYSLSTQARRDGDGGLPRVRPDGRVPIIFGSLTRSPDGERRHNSALALDAAGNLSEPVHKNVLLVFGEYVPFYRQLPFLQAAFPRAEGFAPGERPGVLALGPVRAGVLNCYEDILPEFGRELAARGPNLLVNVTNDAWFGDTSEPWLHQALAVFRAVELRRDLVRAVNTGVSGFIDATGKIAKHTRTFRKATIDGDVRLLEGETAYARMGDVVPWACLALLVALAVWPRRPAS
ncbi:MAG: apolipoprotein N-acyltransferase [Deltaproteobacteria bacterium]|nr:apolipoprotein N-acyltransferase [Deltaproteobacteria bacterium]